MNNLNELIGNEVIYQVETDTLCFEEVKCKIIDIQINDYYFEEHNGPIYIEVNLQPIGKIPKGLDHEYFSNIELQSLRKSQ